MKDRPMPPRTGDLAELVALLAMQSSWSIWSTVIPGENVRRWSVCARNIPGAFAHGDDLLEAVRAAAENAEEVGA